MKSFVGACAAAAFVLSAPPGLALDAVATPDVQVFVIGVSQPANYAALPAAQQRVEDLQKFFRDSYGLQPDRPRQPGQFHVYADFPPYGKKGDMTEDRLRTIPDSIASFIGKAKTIVFLFVLSHGIAVPTDDGSDLVIVGSDTPPDTRPDALLGSDRLFGRDIFRALLNIHQHSVVFVFFDTCSSGALQNAGLSIFTLFRYKRVRIVSLASSHSSEESYNFDFTEGLLHYWDALKPARRCETIDNLAQDLPSQDEDPQVLVSDGQAGDGPACMNAIGPREGAVFVVPGYAGPARIAINEPNEPVGDPPHPKPLDAGDGMPLMLMPLPRTDIELLLLDPDPLGSKVSNWHSDLYHLAATPMIFQDLTPRNRNKNPYAINPDRPQVPFPPQSPLGPQVRQ
jgi:hypothetical protein